MYNHFPLTPIPERQDLPLVKNPQYRPYQGEIYLHSDINKSTVKPCAENVEYLRRHTLLGGVPAKRVGQWLFNHSRSRKHPL